MHHLSHSRKLLPARSHCSFPPGFLKCLRLCSKEEVIPAELYANLISAAVVYCWPELEGAAKAAVLEKTRLGVQEAVVHLEDAVEVMSQTAVQASLQLNSTGLEEKERSIEPDVGIHMLIMIRSTGHLDSPSTHPNKKVGVPLSLYRASNLWPLQRMWLRSVLFPSIDKGRDLSGRHTQSPEAQEY